MFKTIYSAILAAAMLCASVVATASPLDGAYFDPDRPGWGINILTTPGFAGNIGVMWVYNYDVNGNQAWFISDAFDADDLIYYRPVTVDIYQPSAGFNAWDFELDKPVGNVTLTFRDGLIDYNWYFDNWGPCRPVMPGPVWPGCRGSVTLFPLMP